MFLYSLLHFYLYKTKMINIQTLIKTKQTSNIMILAVISVMAVLRRFPIALQ